jgi:hypothetical protein
MKHLIISSLFFVLLCGCSTLQTRVHKNVDWSAYTSVAISVGEPDRWELRPLVSEQLAGWGMTPVEHNQNPDLLVIVEIGQGTSLAETGEVVHWPKDLLLRIHDSSDGSELARSRYQLAPTQQPRHGLALMVNDIQKRTGKATGALQQPQPAANKEAKAAVPPAPAAFTELTTTPSPTASATYLKNTDEKNQPSVSGTPPTLEEGSKAEKTESSWIPQFKGWQIRGDNKTEETY